MQAIVVLFSSFFFQHRSRLCLLLPPPEITWPYSIFTSINYLLRDPVENCGALGLYTVCVCVLYTRKTRHQPLLGTFRNLCSFYIICRIISVDFGQFLPVHVDHARDSEGNPTLGWPFAICLCVCLCKWPLTVDSQRSWVRLNAFGYRSENSSDNLNTFDTTTSMMNVPICHGVVWEKLGQPEFDKTNTAK